MQPHDGGGRRGEPEFDFAPAKTHTHFLPEHPQVWRPPLQPCVSSSCLSGSLGGFFFFGERPGCQGPWRLLYSITATVAMASPLLPPPAVMNVCTPLPPPAERDPAEGGVISLTSISQMTPPERFAEARRQKRKKKKSHTCTLVCCNYQHFTPGSERSRSTRKSFYEHVRARACEH